MAERTPRLAYANRMDAAVVTVSSEQAGMPKNWLKSPLVTKAWRSLLGWSVVRGFNDLLHFDEGGVSRLAVLTQGSYPTGQLLAAEITSRLNDAGILPLELAPSGWWIADEVAASHGDAVGTWPDVSGNGRNLTQATPALKPTMALGAINGRAALRFESENLGGAALSTFLDGSLHGTMFVVFTPAGMATEGSILGDGFRALSYNPASTGSVKAYAYDGTADVAEKGPAALNAWHVGVWACDGSFVSAWADDQDTAAGVSTVTGAQTSGSDLAVGGGLTGFLAEVIIFPSVLTEENRRRVTKYLKQKYALTEGTTEPAWTNTYTASYTLPRFTLARTTGAATFELPFSTAKFVARDAHRDLGFPDTDVAGLTSYLANNDAYQSRAFIRLDLGSALDVQVLAALGTNLGSGTITARGFTDANFKTAGFTQQLTTSVSGLVSWLSAVQAYRYWELRIEDGQNTAGYSQVGIFWLGIFFQPARSIAQGYTEGQNDLSTFQQSDFGAIFQDKKANRRIWQVQFRRLSAANRDTFDAIQAAVGIGGAMVVSLDPQNLPSETRYVVLTDAFAYAHSVGDGTPPDRWSVSAAFLEAVV